MLITGLSGNEIYCLAQKGWSPGDVVLGNSVHSLGFVSGVASGFKTMSGGELDAVTELISDGRHAAIKRMEEEATRGQASGVTGVVSDLKTIGNMVEFLAVGSAVRNTTHTGPFFTTACSGQDLYCQIDAGYEPRHFVIGNVAYALGVGRGFMAALRGFSGGEVKEISQMVNHTRHLALERLEKEAKQRGANAVVDIMTHVLPFGGPGAKEMLMVGTASHNPVLGNPDRPVTSELTGEELWNLTTLGYQPVRLLLGTSVYALGFSGGVASFLKSFSRGEVDAMTRLVYEARENALEHIRREAKELHADAVIGVKLFINEIGNSFVEVLAIGTAIRRNAECKTHSPQLVPQAIIRDRDTFFDRDLQPAAQSLERK